MTSYYVDNNSNYYTNKNGEYYVHRFYAETEPMFKKKSCAYIFINGQFKRFKPMIAKNSTAILVDAILIDENGNILIDENNQVLYTQILAPVGDCAFSPYIPKIF